MASDNATKLSKRGSQAGLNSGIAAGAAPSKDTSFNKEEVAAPENGVFSEAATSSHWLIDDSIGRRECR
ncbi:hypothetical protein NZD89_17780 [Alicyclobacillus fastidiosus]|uniref:Uncharacterized protein n=1 Tax=Alicyclobacillus fastidiosus TaxID=392011 RepID=A0ABY6ZCF4_9BACL|nr:hypothetical protein [Alicyclobacillus fastidiosus]WAH40218.1 hypothetical protein NZD89_17780 [Alicyclobacillus fastidiosus]